MPRTTKNLVQRVKYLFGQHTPKQRLVLLRTRQKFLDLHIEAAVQYAKEAEDFDLGLRRYVTAFQLDSTTAAIILHLATLRFYCVDEDAADATNAATDAEGEVPQTGPNTPD